MGCSPSKGRLFSKPGLCPTVVTLDGQEPKDKAGLGPVEDDNGPLKTEERQEKKKLLTEEHVQETATCIMASEPLVEKQQDSNTPEEKAPLTGPQTPPMSKTGKSKKNKAKRKFADKKRNCSAIGAKVDFPPQMVKAHQAAYTFLHPNISKYEALLGLLDQATQTKTSLQPMMSALLLHFEEVTQALEEIAEEGELMLREHGDFLALPSGMRGPLCFSVDRAPPPDLVQLLLKHSTEKMRLVGKSVQAVGDTTLEDAVDYFSSLSNLLVEKLQSKRAAEQRLVLVLAHVERAAVKGYHPEDSSLHSEDSGIGGENESVTGSERHRHHRGSGSGSCGSGMNIQGVTDNPTTNSHNRLDHNEDEEDHYYDEDDDEDNDEYEDDESDGPERRRSNSSPPDPSQAFFYMQFKSLEDQRASVIGPPSSTKTSNIVADLKTSQKDLDQRMKKNMNPTQKNEMGLQTQKRRYSFNGLGAAQKDTLQTFLTPYFPILTPRPPKRKTVRRLIHTFSQGVDGRPGQSHASVAPHALRPRTGVVLLPCDGNARGVVTNATCWPEGKDETDAENLPPPPPEVLMDNSFQRNDSLTGNKQQSQENSGFHNRKTRPSNRLKASMQDIEVLPNRISLRPRLTPIPPAHPVRQDAVMETQDTVPQAETDLDLDTEKAQSLYQQARKIINLRNSVECRDQRNSMDSGHNGSLPLQARTAKVNESRELYGGASSCTLPVIAPPVSRVRLPPSCPSVRHQFPVPPVIRPQSATPNSSRPSSPRAVVRASDNSPEEIIPSVSFRDARSVFCQNETQFTHVPEGSVLPTVRGRIPSRGINARRTQSEQRPAATYRSDVSRDNASTQIKGF